MSGRIASAVSVVAVAIASPITIGAGVIVYESLAPPEHSLVTAIMERLGEGESAQADAAREAEARYQFRLTQAQEENRRVTAAYSNIYGALRHALQRSVDLETDIARIQARNVNDSQWAKRFGTNVADIGCMLSMVSPDSELKGACEAGNQLRQDMAGQYQEVLSANRPTLVSDIMRDFPDPSVFMQSEFDRASDEFLEEADAP